MKRLFGIMCALLVCVAMMAGNLLGQRIANL